MKNLLSIKEELSKTEGKFICQIKSSYLLISSNASLDYFDSEGIKELISILDLYGVSYFFDAITKEDGPSPIVRVFDITTK